MSVVKIVSHNENVYSLKEKDKVETIKPPRYNSIYREMVRDEEKTRKKNCGHKTFGYPEVLLNPPDEFLKKYARNSRTTGNRRDHHHHHYVHLKAALPHEYALILHQNINHISKNVSEVTKNAAARRRPTSSCFVDSKRGDFFDLEKSGLMPKYVFQDKFGKTPNYIQKRKDSANKLKMQKETEAELHSSRIRIISERERNEILMGLKTNWDILQKVYTALPVMMTDTIPKMTRKTRLENQLKEIEKDILLLEKNQVLAVI